MKALHFMGYYRNHQTAATEAQYSNYRAHCVEQAKNKQEVQLLGMAIHVHVMIHCDSHVYVNTIKIND